MNALGFCVYIIRSKTSGKAYYGSTNNFKRRRSQHLQSLRRGTHHSCHLQNAWNIYQESDFVMEVLHQFSNEAEMLACEKSFLVNIRNTYNVSTEVDKGHTRGRPRSDATKAKLSAMFKGRFLSEKTKELIRIARAKQVMTNAGIPLSEETKAKIKLARAKQISRKGHKATEELRQKLSAAKKGKEYPRVKVVTPDGVYIGVKNAAKHYGINVATVRYRVKNNFLGWKYESL